MAKIIKHGARYIFPEKPAAGTKIGCKCGCEFELEEGDINQLIYSGSCLVPNADTYSTFCPECKGAVTIYVRPR